MLCDEVVQTKVELKNIGLCPLEKLYIASSFPELFTFGSIDSYSDAQATYQMLTDKEIRRVSPEADVREVFKVAIPGDELAPGSSIKMPVWVQGTGSQGKHQRDIMFYYESANKLQKTRQVKKRLHSTVRRISSNFDLCSFLTCSL